MIPDALLCFFNLCNEQRAWHALRHLLEKRSHSEQALCREPCGAESSENSIGAAEASFEGWEPRLEPCVGWIRRLMAVEVEVCRVALSTAESMLPFLSGERWQTPEATGVLADHGTKATMRYFQRVHTQLVCTVPHPRMAETERERLLESVTNVLVGAGVVLLEARGSGDVGGFDDAALREFEMLLGSDSD